MTPSAPADAGYRRRTAVRRPRCSAVAMGLASMRHSGHYALLGRCPSLASLTGDYRDVMSDFMDKAKAALGDLKDNPLLDKAEDIADDKAQEAGTIGSIADKADDAIDQIQGTKD